jgi:D-hydroxyproline dehydrogenase subunit beta
MSARPDALVVGAGVVGAACARTLAGEGLRVRVVDANRPGGGATAAGMGHITVMDDSEAQFALTRYSLALLEEVADVLPAAAEVDRCGTLWVAEDAEQLDLVRAKREFYGARGVDTRILDGSELAAEEPALRPDLAGALLVPGDMVLYPPALALWLLEEARSAGACVDAGVTVDRIEPGAVVVGGQRVEAGLVVNAAGAWAPRLTPGLPIVPRKGHLVITDRYPGFCRHQLVELGYLKSAHTLEGESVAFNVQPRATGQLLIGSSRELVGWDGSLNRRVVARMLERATSFLPALRGLSTIRIWTGMRPATPDKLPLLGPWPGGHGLWIAAGHEGLGITTALGSGRLLADLILGQTPAIDPLPYSPLRVAQEA